MPGWLSQSSVRLLVLAQVMISQLVDLSPALASVLAAVDPTWDSLSPSLSAPLPIRSLSLSLSQNK